MKPGTVLFDNNFKFKDGKRGKKFLIVLNDGTPGYYIVVKTTSISNYKGNTYGCQINDRYPNFFLPHGSCAFEKHTWIILTQYYEFTTYKLLAKNFDGELNIIFYLPEDITIEILNCALDSEDIILSHEKILTDMVKQLSKSKTKASKKK